MQTLCLIHNKGIMFKSRDTLIKIIHRIYFPIATRLASINGRPYMACTFCADVNNTQSYDHEHALLLCPKVTKFWTSVKTLLISITRTCYLAYCNGFTNIISLLTLASCNIDQNYPDFVSKTLSTTQNIMGFALTTIITLGNNGSSEDLLKSFSKLLTEFLQTDPWKISINDEHCIKTFITARALHHWISNFNIIYQLF